MVFVGSNRQADFIASYLSESGLPATSMHGARAPLQRRETLRQFESGQMDVIVTTDLLSFGLSKCRSVSDFFYVLIN